MPNPRIIYIKLLHRGYIGMINSGDGDEGMLECPYDFYREWILEPVKARAKAEVLTRITAEIDECPIHGIPNKASKIPDVTVKQPELGLVRQPVR